MRYRGKGKLIREQFKQQWIKLQNPTVSTLKKNPLGRRYNEATPYTLPTEQRGNFQL